MYRSQEELDLEQEIISGRIDTLDEFLRRLKEVYVLVNGDYGREIFDNVILGALPVVHRGDLKAAGLEALALIAESSTKPPQEVPTFLGTWAVGKIGPGSDISPLESMALGSKEEVDLTNPNYALPVLLYSNDSRFKRPSENWGPVYKSSAATLSHQATLTKISQENLSIDVVIGAKSARITRRAYPAGYVGEINGNEFNAQKGNDPLIIIYGLVSEAGYKHGSDEEYGFLYMVTSQGTTTRRVRWYNPNKTEVPAVTAVFAVLPRQDYEEMVKNQFRDVEQFVLNMLPDKWKDYLKEGGFFSKPKVIGRIDAQSPHLNYG